MIAMVYTGKFHGDNPDASEFSWGTGMTPKGLEEAPPSQGGRYRGTTPLSPAAAALDKAERDRLAREAGLAKLQRATERINSRPRGL
ncbi:hypothetical protein R4P65_27560 [Rhodococcus sp. IEGM 1318]|nr:hypothetical protein [Rhodococcus sp. IEGM 1318]